MHNLLNLIRWTLGYNELNILVPSSPLYADYTVILFAFFLMLTSVILDKLKLIENHFIIQYTFSD